MMMMMMMIVGGMSGIIREGDGAGDRTLWCLGESRGVLEYFVWADGQAGRQAGRQGGREAGRGLSGAGNGDG